MNLERCAQCGFDGGTWTDAEATARLAELPALWAASINGIDPTDLLRRPILGMWSVAEYTDHVRETVFGMRFVLERALTEPGVDLGTAPEPRFDPEPRPINVSRALAAFEEEVGQLLKHLTALGAERWSSGAVIGGEPVDVHWIVRHAVHDVSHHLGDVERLGAALE